MDCLPLAVDTLHSYEETRNLAKLNVDLVRALGDHMMDLSARKIVRVLCRGHCGGDVCFGNRTSFAGIRAVWCLNGGWLLVGSNAASQ